MGGETGGRVWKRGGDGGTGGLRAMLKGVLISDSQVLAGTK